MSCSTDPRVTLSEHDGLANASLEIRDMDFEDRAEYICVATNGIGSGNSTIMVRVKGQYLPTGVVMLINPTPAQPNRCASGLRTSPVCVTTNGISSGNSTVMVRVKGWYRCSVAS